MGKDAVFIPLKYELPDASQIYNHMTDYTSAYYYFTHSGDT